MDGFMNKIIAVVLALVIGATLVGGLLVPTVQAVTTTEQTFENEGLWRMKEIKNGDVWTFSNSPATWVCNGETQTGIYSSGSNGMLGDNWLIRSNGQARGPFISGNATSLSATADEINITFSGLSGTLTYPISGYGIDNTGDYILSDYTKPVYINGDSIIYGTGVSGVDDIGCTINVVATVDGGATFTMMSNRNSSDISNAVFSNVTINYEAVDGFKDLYKVASITADVTFDNTVEGVTTNHTGSVSYSSYVVPYKVTAERSQHLDTVQVAMFGVIGLLGIVLLVTIAASAVRSKY